MNEQTASSKLVPVFGISPQDWAEEIVEMVVLCGIECRSNERMRQQQFGDILRVKERCSICRIHFVKLYCEKGLARGK